MKPKDILGRRFGRLLVEKHVGSDKHGQAVWECLCDCGTRSAKKSCRLISGQTRSCGCLHREVVAARVTTHGFSVKGSATKGLYRIWKCMIYRCHNEADPAYDNYGGRGIAVCERWRESFESFVADMGPRPSPKHTMDRIDNDGPYEPGNCRWGTKKEQCRNKRTNHVVTFNGETMILQDWADKIGISTSALIFRLRRWPLEKAMTTPRASRYSVAEIHNDS